MLDTNLKQQLTTYLQNLTSAVELSVFLGDDVKSKELETLVAEIDDYGDVTYHNAHAAEDGASERGVFDLNPSDESDWERG